MVRKNFFCFSSWATLYIQNAHQILLVRTEQSSRRNHTVSLKDMGSFINNVTNFPCLCTPPRPSEISKNWSTYENSFLTSYL